MRVQTTTRHIALRRRAAGLVTGLGLVLFTFVAPAPAADDLEAQARSMLKGVFDILATGDRDQVAPILGNEFQVVRSDGGAYDKEEYLAKSIPKISNIPVFDEVVATRNGDIIVVRFVMEYESVIDGKKASERSPQLIVFRLLPDGWEVVAAANFAALTVQ